MKLAFLLQYFHCSFGLQILYILESFVQIEKILQYHFVLENVWKNWFKCRVLLRDAVSTWTVGPWPPD